MARTPRVLITEDEPDLLESLKFRLEHRGYLVSTACDGIEALKAVRSEPPDILLLDVMMPGENGYRVANQIRQSEADNEERTHLPIILLTARDLSSDEEREKMFMDFSGADLMLYKPFDIDDLVGNIERLLSPVQERTSVARAG